MSRIKLQKFDVKVRKEPVVEYSEEYKRIVEEADKNIIKAQKEHAKAYIKAKKFIAR